MVEFCYFVKNGWVNSLWSWLSRRELQNAIENKISGGAGIKGRIKMNNRHNDRK